MPYVLPQMPLRCATFDNLGLGTYTLDNIGESRDSGIECNLVWGRNAHIMSTGGTTEVGILVALMTLLFPAGTDIRGPEDARGFDFIQIQIASNLRFYGVVQSDHIGLGFANWHGGALLYAIPGSL